MQNFVELRLGIITDIWNEFIWKFNFCSSYINFSDEVKTNYFGDILGYFRHTNYVVFSNKEYSDFKEKFSFAISFLQAIYVQQDLILEMLGIFEISKKEVFYDPLFSVNRKIRNELIGHPILRDKKSKELISSTLFGYGENGDEIGYLRYHKENNFRCEVKIIKIFEIEKRHQEFLEKYFDKILSKLQLILEEYLLKLDDIEKKIHTLDFNSLLELVDKYFEVIVEFDFLYNKNSLYKIYNRRNEHRRYQNFIDCFYNDLTSLIRDKKNSIDEIFQRIAFDSLSLEDLRPPEINVVFVEPKEKDRVAKPEQETYHYEIAGIAIKRNLREFNFFSDLLKKKCKDNNLILNELDHMKQNFFDEIEYYTSLQFIRIELKTKTGN